MSGKEAGVKRLTIRDVAARAGVSHQTVSRVVNGDNRVSVSTRERVLAAIRELDFVPNAVARSLSSNRTHTLGVVTADVSDYAFGQTVAGAEAEARRRGYYLVVGSVADASDGKNERTYLRLLLERRVEGLILDWPTLGPESGSALAATAARVPLVLVAATTALPNVQSVDIDNRRGGCEAVAHLTQQGHRRVATITGPLEWNAAQARLEGYRDALGDAGIVESSSLVQACPDWGPESGRTAAAQLLDRGEDFTALFAQSDLLAVGAMAELRSRGIRVPEEVSIVGFDDIPVASFLQPPLTTMRQPIRELGEVAARLIIEAIGRHGAEAEVEQRRLLLPARLVSRGSVRHPQGARP